MRLRCFQIRNFKGIESASLSWEDILVLIGENNAGKSTVLDALEWFLSSDWDKTITDKELFFHRDTSETIELIGHFDQLSERERINVPGEPYKGFWILAKRFWEEEDVGFQCEWQYCSNSDDEPCSADAEPFNEELSWRDLEDDDDYRGVMNHLPKLITVRAVHDVQSETVTRESGALGRVLSLLLELHANSSPKLQALKSALDGVRDIFRRSGDNEGVHNIAKDLNTRLGKVFQAKADLEFHDLTLTKLLVPQIDLVIDDGFKTHVAAHGHGLQRAVIMTLLQMLADYDMDSDKRAIFAIEEPELYMHPQMERKTRNTLYQLASKHQVICTTHSPVFIDMSQNHMAIVRVVKSPDSDVDVLQFPEDIFSGQAGEVERSDLRMITKFDPAVNEVFFAKKAVLVEGDTEVAIFRELARLQGIEADDITIVNCHGKYTILLFMKVLNHFNIPYTVFHDRDKGNSRAFPANDQISALLTNGNQRFMFCENIEHELKLPTGNTEKPIRALRQLRTLHAADKLPRKLLRYVEAAFTV